MKVRQAEVFNDINELNNWLAKNHQLEIINIDFKFAPASYHRYFVQYYKPVSN